MAHDHRMNPVGEPHLNRRKFGASWGVVDTSDDETTSNDDMPMALVDMQERDNFNAHQDWFENQIEKHQ